MRRAPGTAGRRPGPRPRPARADSRARLPASLWGALAVLALGGCRQPVLEVPVVVRNHHDLAIDADSGPIPLYLRPASRPGVCLEVAATTDTSRWEARLTLGGAPLQDGFAPPSARMGRVVCFEGEIPPEAPAPPTELCGVVVDRFDGRAFRLPCRPIRVLLDTRYPELRKERSRLLRSSVELELDELLRRLDALAEKARSRFPVFATRLDLIAVHFLREDGTPEARAEATRRLGSLPAWLDRPEASGLAAEAEREKALLELDALDLGGSLARAWRHLAAADRRARSVAYPKRFMVVESQADILARQGAVVEAVERLRAALDDCRFAPCDPALLPSGYGQLAWLIQLQAEPTAAELEEAEAALRRFLDQLPDHVPLERINQLLNLALLQVRRGAEPAETLERARTLIDRTTIGTGSLRDQRAWLGLIPGLAALEAGDPEAARRACADLGPVSDPRIQALAASCEARARRAVGDLAGARSAFETALELHELGTSRKPGTGLPPGFGPESEDFARAARLAVELGRPERAWSLLARLDTRSVLARQRRRCRDQASDPATLDRWRRIDAEAEEILGELARLEVPASPARRREIALARRALTGRLRELWRRWPGCPEVPTAAYGGPGYRAAALEDEILLLHRDADGRVSTARRTPFPRRRLRGLVEQIAARREPVDDATWRRTLAQVARALVPDDPGSLPAVTRFSLHGLLQGLPLAALPLPATEGRDPEIRWLGQATTPVIVPAGGRGRPGPAGEPAAPLFLVDPSGDLPGGTDLLPLYRRLFPTARFLSGPAATRAAVVRSLAASDWLHIDAHGRYEPGFPELSGLRLADGPVTFIELAGLPAPRRFANLSGCQTGRWPLGEDSGRFGIAGLLAQLGSAWVVASRHPLDDRLAHDFNRPFYRAVAAGRTVPEAYSTALAELRGSYPAASWSVLLLLSSADEGAIGPAEDSFTFRDPGSGLLAGEATGGPSRGGR